MSKMCARQQVEVERILLPSRHFVRIADMRRGRQLLNRNVVLSWHAPWYSSSMQKGRLRMVYDGESLVNDATGLVAYRFAVAAVVSGTFSLWQA
jgi:hypothetical protein